MPRLPGFTPDCTLTFDGERLGARRGESLASALLAAGRPLLARSAKYHRPRGPFCLAGSCGSCLVRADGLPDQRACRLACREGLEVQSQHAVPNARHDLLGLVDLLAPGGIDHHHLQTWSLAANKVAVALARRLAGLGRLPDPGVGPASTVREALEEEDWDALVVGAGPAGLGAAGALSDVGLRVLVAEAEPRAGGRLRARLPGDPGLAWADERVGAIGAAGGEVATGAAVLGLWRDGGAPRAAIRVEGGAGGGIGSLRLVRAARIVLCPGGHPQPPGLPGDDRPGVLAARGALAAIAEHGAVPGERLAVIGPAAERAAVVAALGAAGVEAAAVEGAPRAFAGRGRVRAVVLAGGRLRCDAVLVAGPPAPATELARHLGAAVRFDPAAGAHAVAVDREGRTGVPGLFAAGEVTGACSAAEAGQAGRRAGEAAR